MTDVLKNNREWSIQTAILFYSGKMQSHLDHAIGVAQCLADWVGNSKSETDKEIRKRCAEILASTHTEFFDHSMLIKQLEKIYSYVSDSPQTSSVMTDLLRNINKNIEGMAEKGVKVAL